MRHFVIFALIAVVRARPDVSEIVKQQHNLNTGSNALDTGAPQRVSLYEGISSYEAPSVSGNTLQVSDEYTGFVDLPGSSVPAVGVQTFGASSTSSVSTNVQGSSRFDASSEGVVDGGVHQGQSKVFDISSQAASGSNTVVRPVAKQGAPQIIKSFYIHEAPEDEPANVEVREKEINVRPLTHYKIIFIKPPASQAGGAFGGSAAIFPQNEEKTVVYVLLKKADGGISENGEFPTPPPAITSKPEVVFVKYRTNEEAAGAISSIQESFKEGGAGFENPAQFAQSIGASSGSSSASASSFSQSRSNVVEPAAVNVSNDFSSSTNEAVSGSDKGSNTDLPAFVSVDESVTNILPSVPAAVPSSSSQTSNDAQAASELGIDIDEFNKIVNKLIAQS